jgi:hypothetical protein
MTQHPSLGRPRAYSCRTRKDASAERVLAAIGLVAFRADNRETRTTIGCATASRQIDGGSGWGTSPVEALQLATPPKKPPVLDAAGSAKCPYLTRMPRPDDGGG